MGKQQDLEQLYREAIAADNAYHAALDAAGIGRWSVPQGPLPDNVCALYQRKVETYAAFRRAAFPHAER